MMVACPALSGTGGWIMPKIRKRTKIHVRLGEHAEKRWIERAMRPPGRLADLIAMLLIESMGAGLCVHHGRAMLPLDAELLDLPQDLVACIDLPDIYGIWKVVTFKPINHDNGA
jgi:hypothetical protein